MGEFSTGKSSLVNLLLGQKLLPTRATATQIPGVMLEHGPAGVAVATRRDGRVVSVGSDDPMALDYRVYAFVRLRNPAPVLKKVTLFDTPGISDPLLPLSAHVELADTLDTVLWCTPATHAWRESEHAAWRQIPAALRERATLVVTKSDLIGDTDRTRIEQRLARETEGLFAHRIFLSASDAEAARSASDAEWHESGGAALLSVLGLTRADLGIACQTEPAAHVAPAPPSQPAPVVHSVQDQVQPPVAGIDIAALATVPGCLGASLVDCETGLMLRSVGGGDLDLDAAATEAAGVLRAARRLSSEIEDLVVNAGALVHLLRPLLEEPNLAVHLILDPARAEPQSARARMDTAIQDRGPQRRGTPPH
ncbi:MAG: hypothetical protein AAGA32_06415 [Pseudomonadota bacterium]